MDLLRTVVWRNLNDPGTEYCRLFHTATGVRLEGHVIVALNHAPLDVQYQVACDMHWRTQAVTVEVSQGALSRRLQITVDHDQTWWANGDEIERLRGCQDVDLAVTPSTNTLPIRRLDLPIGNTDDVVAAWVRFPELELEPLPQSYTRLAKTLYRYESDSGRFTTQLEVDELGLVVRYARGWQREAVSTG